MLQRWSTEPEDHPFETFIPDGAEILVLGTFPTHKSNYENTFRFFYAGKANKFWSLFATTFGIEFRQHSGEGAVLERKRWLNEKRIGISDMISSCYRKGNSSRDKQLFPVAINDIVSILRKHKSISRLVLTSRTIPHGALGILQINLIQNAFEVPTMKISSDKVLEGNLHFENRTIEILVPYSPSQIVVDKGHTTLRELKATYRRCLQF